MFFASLALLGAGPAGSHGRLSDPVRSRCYDELSAALRNDSPWVRAHAAEALALSNRPEPALAACRPIAETAEPKYRIVVWRILAQAEPAQRRRYVDRIRAALLDPTGPDRTHAMEALAKLHEPAADDAERQQVREIAEARGEASPFAAWRLAQANDPTAVQRLLSLLQMEDAATRTRAAYVLGRIGPMPQPARDAIAAAIRSEPADSPVRAILQLTQGPDAARAVAQDGRVAPSGRYLAAMSLAYNGTARDYETLAALLDNSDADVRVAAAFAMLQIDLRAATTSPATQPDSEPQEDKP